MNSTKLVVALTALNVAVCAFTLARTATPCAKPETPKEESQAATAESPQHAAVCDCGFREFRAKATNAVLKLESDYKKSGINETVTTKTLDRESLRGRRHRKEYNDLLLKMGCLFLGREE